MLMYRHCWVFCELLMLHMNSTDVFGFFSELPEILVLGILCLLSRMVKNSNKDSAYEWSNIGENYPGLFFY